MPARRSHMFIGLVVMVALTVGVLMWFTLYQQKQRLARFSVEAEGTIVAVDLTSYIVAGKGRERTDTIVVNQDDGKRRTTTHIRYRYTVGGSDVENEKLVRGDAREDYRTGARVKVCFDPAHPREAVIIDSGETCGG